MGCGMLISDSSGNMHPVTWVDVGYAANLYNKHGADIFYDATYYYTLILVLLHG